jgi:hypothetical protein
VVKPDCHNEFVHLKELARHFKGFLEDVAERKKTEKGILCHQEVVQVEVDAARAEAEVQGKVVDRAWVVVVEALARAANAFAQNAAQPLHISKVSLASK